MIIAKHRNGELGDIPVYMLGKIVRFVDDDYITRYNVNAEQEEAAKPQFDGGDAVFGGDNTEGEFIVSSDENTEQE